MIGSLMPMLPPPSKILIVIAVITVSEALGWLGVAIAAGVGLGIVLSWVDLFLGRR